MSESTSSGSSLSATDSVAGFRSLSPVTILCAMVPFVIIGFLYADTIAGVAYTCWTDEDYSHGLILPIISLYLIATKQDELTRRLFGASAENNRAAPPVSKVGILVLLLGIVTYLLGVVSQLLFVYWVSFFLTTFGVLQLVLGTSGAAPFIAPVGLLFMAKPIPDSLIPKLFWPLQVLAARISARVLELLDVPVYLLGNIIEIPEMRLMVEEACSGMRSLMALITVALIVVLIVEMKTWAKIFIFFTSIITAIVLNIIRIAATGVLSHFYDPSAAQGFFHTFSGLIVFIIGLAVVFSIASFLATPPKKEVP